MKAEDKTPMCGPGRPQNSSLSCFSAFVTDVDYRCAPPCLDIGPCFDYGFEVSPLPIIKRCGGGELITIGFHLRTKASTEATLCGMVLMGCLAVFIAVKKHDGRGNSYRGKYLIGGGGGGLIVSEGQSILMVTGSMAACGQTWCWRSG